MVPMAPPLQKASTTTRGVAASVGAFTDEPRRDEAPARN